MADDYDSPWKEAIERYFADFMAFYFPDAHEQIDWTQPLIFLDQELRAAIREAELGKRVVDKLARVTGRGGNEEWIYIHLEVQGSEQADFAERMFICHSRLFDRYRKPIASLALLTDDRPNWRPSVYVHDVLGCRLGLRYPVAKLLDWSGNEARLQDSRNPFALLTLAHLATRTTRHDPDARYSAKWRLVKQLYQRGFARQQVIDWFNMIDWMMHLPGEQARQFRDALMQFEEAMKMRYVNSIERLARDEGMQQGQHAAKRQMAERLLAIRFGRLPDWAKARLAAATEEELDVWTEALLSAPSIGAVFEAFGH